MSQSDTTKRQYGSPTSWLDTLLGLTQQVVLMISSAWNVSFSIMSNIGQLERLKEVIEQFNSIVLDPTHHLIQTMGNSVTLYVDQTNHLAYMDSGISGTRTGSSAELVGQVRLSLVFNHMRYQMVRERHECNGMYVFVLREGVDCIDDIDQVLINGTGSQIAVEFVQDVPFAYTDDSMGVTTSSYDSTRNNYIKLSARTSAEYIRNRQCVDNWQKHLTNDENDGVFTQRYMSYYLSDSQQKTVKMHIEVNTNNERRTE